jgi:hypothetical protein
MMDMTFEMVRMEEITEDINYCLRCGREKVPRSLSASLDRVGILHPLIVQLVKKRHGKKPGEYILICGFARLEWARRSGVHELPVRVAPTERPDVLLRLAVEDNLQGRGLNIIEQATAIGKMQALKKGIEKIKPLMKQMGIRFQDETVEGENEENVWGLLDRFGYKASPGVIERLASFLDLPPEVKNALVNGIISEGLVPFLSAFSDDEQVKLVKVIGDLKLSVGASRDLAREALEVCRRDNLGMAELLHGVGYVGMAADEHNSEQMGNEVAVLRDRVLSGVHHRRFPILTELYGRYQEAHRKMGLPKGFAIRAPKDFEGDRYVIEGRVRSAEELEKALESILAGMREKRGAFDEAFDVRFEEKKER